MWELILCGIIIIVCGIAVLVIFGGILALIEQQIDYFRK